MTFLAKDRVRETTVTTGTGEYMLAGSPIGFQPFSEIGVGNTCPYYATDNVDWEVGIGTVQASPARLARTSIAASSNGGAAVDWGGGSKDVICALPSFIAFPQRLSKSVAGGADVTLTEVEGHQQIIEFTGALTANINVILPSTPWIWMITNNTTGAFTLTVKTSGGGGVVVQQTKRMPVYFDGVDIVAAFTDAAAFGADPGFDLGTRMSFFQTAAPTGWVKDTSAAYNDAALRVVTGAVGSGGVDGFSTHFGAGKATAAYALTIADMPPHGHGVNDPGHAHTWQEGSNFSGGAWAPGQANAFQNVAHVNAAVTNISIQNAGGGGAHSHVLNNFNIKYADCIIASRA